MGSDVNWKRAWEAEREAHRLLRELAGMGQLDMLGGSPGTLPAPLYDTAYARAVGHATLMESLAVSKEADAGAANPEIRPDTRDPDCVENWPGCYSGGYDPKCCRFPKSCSAES